MIPTIDDIVFLLLAQQCSAEQAKTWLHRHVELAESRITVDVPALGRIADLIEKVAAKELGNV